MPYKHFYYRAENRGFLPVILSEESKRKRHRQYTINIQITFISWALEFTSGIMALIMYFGVVWERNLLIWLLPFDIGLNFIIIPGSYITNNQTNKALIFSNGWRQALVSFVQSNRVVPAQNENVDRDDVLPNANEPPIPSVSGNVRAVSVDSDIQQVPENQQNPSRESLNVPNLLSFEMNTLPNFIDC